MKLYLPKGSMQRKDYLLHPPNGTKKQAVREKDLLRFNRLVDPKTGTGFPANFYYFYPLSPHDYLERMVDLSADTPPIMVFMYLTLACRDRCTGCFANKLRGEGGPLSWEVIARSIQDFGAMKTRSIKFAGRESTLSPHLGQALRLTAKLGIASVLITAGDNLARHMQAVSEDLTHLRVSINASNPALHRQLQSPGRSADDYQTRIGNYEKILAARRQKNLVSGASFLVRPDTSTDIFNTAQKAKELGFDYIRLIFLRNLWEEHKERERIQTQISEEVERSLELAASDFSVWDSLSIPDIPFEPLSHLDPVYWDPALYLRTTVFADGKVVACPSFVVEGMRENYAGVFGNLRQQSFKDIWLGIRRKRFLAEIQKNLSRGKKCPVCKYHELNQILRFMALSLNGTTSTLAPNPF